METKERESSLHHNTVMKMVRSAMVTQKNPSSKMVKMVNLSQLKEQRLMEMAIQSFTSLMDLKLRLLKETKVIVVKKENQEKTVRRQQLKLQMSLIQKEM